MPSWTPEGDVIRPNDNELRTLSKWASCLYAIAGNVSGGPFPEGTIPGAKDNEDRLAKKIELMTCFLNAP